LESVTQRRNCDRAISALQTHELVNRRHAIGRPRRIERTNCPFLNRASFSQNRIGVVRQSPPGPEDRSAARDQRDQRPHVRRKSPHRLWLAGAGIHRTVALRTHAGFPVNFAGPRRTVHLPSSNFSSSAVIVFPAFSVDCLTTPTSGANHNVVVARIPAAEVSISTRKALYFPAGTVTSSASNTFPLILRGSLPIVDSLSQGASFLR